MFWQRLVILGSFLSSLSFHFHFQQPYDMGCFFDFYLVQSKRQRKTVLDAPSSASQDAPPAADDAGVEGAQAEDAEGAKEARSLKKCLKNQRKQSRNIQKHE